MSERQPIDGYEVADRELVRTAAKEAERYGAESETTVAGRAARKLLKCVDDLRGQTPAKQVDLLSFRLGFVARGLLDAVRHRERSVEGGEKRNRIYKYQRSLYQQQVDREMSKGACYTEACCNVAKVNKVHERTVRQHTINKKPRNRRKKLKRQT